MSTPFDLQPILVPDSPNENPLSNGGKWSSITGESPLERIGGFMVWSHDQVGGEMLWNPQTWTDASICAVCNNFSFGGPAAFKLRADSTGLSTYYKGQFSGTQDWEIYKRVNGGAETLIGSNTSSGNGLRTNDRIGFAVIGSTISLWWQARASLTVPSVITDNWTDMISVTDTDIADAGYLTVGLVGSETEIFGMRGGSLFAINPGGGGTGFGPGSPTFNVAIRTVTNRQ